MFQQRTKILHTDSNEPIIPKTIHNSTFPSKFYFDDLFEFRAPSHHTLHHNTQLLSVSGNTSQYMCLCYILWHGYSDTQVTHARKYEIEM